MDLGKLTQYSILRFSEKYAKKKNYRGYQKLQFIVEAVMEATVLAIAPVF